MEKKGDPPFFGFVIKRPCSKKNKMINLKDRRPFPDADVQRDELKIRRAAWLAAWEKGWVHRGEPLSIKGCWMPEADNFVVVVRKVLGFDPTPRKFDLQNILAIICDGVERKDKKGTKLITSDKAFVQAEVYEYGMRDIGSPPMEGDRHCYCFKTSFKAL